MSDWPAYPPQQPPQSPGPPALPPPPAMPGIPPPPVGSHGWSSHPGPSRPSVSMATWGMERAGFGSRLGAYLLDTCVILLLLLPTVVGLVLIGVATWETEPGYTCTDRFGRSYACEGPTGGTIVVLVGLFIAYLVAVVLIQYLVRARPLARTGQTIGKRTVGLRVVRLVDGELLSPGQAIGREAFALFISGQLFGLGYLWMLWDDQNQTWQDKVVGSIVVRA